MHFWVIFAKKIHTEQICVRKSDGSEFCVNGDQLEQVVGGISNPNATIISIPSNPEPTPESIPELNSEPPVSVSNEEDLSFAPAETETEENQPPQELSAN